MVSGCLPLPLLLLGAIFGGTTDAFAVVVEPFPAFGGPVTFVISAAAAAAAAGADCPDWLRATRRGRLGGRIRCYKVIKKFFSHSPARSPECISFSNRDEPRHNVQRRQLLEQQLRRIRHRNDLEVAPVLAQPTMMYLSILQRLRRRSSTVSKPPTRLLRHS